MVPNKLVKDTQCRGSGRCSDVDVCYQAAPPGTRLGCDLLPGRLLSLCGLRRIESPRKQSCHLRRVTAVEHFYTWVCLHCGLPNTSHRWIVRSNLVLSVRSSVSLLHGPQLARLITLLPLWHLIHRHRGLWARPLQVIHHCPDQMQRVCVMVCLSCLTEVCLCVCVCVSVHLLVEMSVKWSVLVYELKCMNVYSCASMCTLNPVCLCACASVFRVIFNSWGSITISLVWLRHVWQPNTPTCSSE